MRSPVVKRPTAPRSGLRAFFPLGCRRSVVRLWQRVRSSLPSAGAPPGLPYTSSGSVSCPGVLWRGASRAARWRSRGRRRRRRSRVARRSAGEPDACGPLPPRKRPAIGWTSLGACVAFPPWRACMARACPRTNGRPARAHRSASPDPVTRPAPQTPRSSREGARAVRKASGPAGLVRCPRLAPSGGRMQRDRVRACRSRPQYGDPHRSLLRRGAGWHLSLPQALYVGLVSMS